jgi:hypothetical protein
MLQYADVSHHDWHSGQILGKAVHQPTGLPDKQLSQDIHCVLVDFSATTQSIKGELHRMDDFGTSLSVLTFHIGMDFAMVWQHYDQREFWDTCVMIARIGDKRKIARAADPYEFIYHEQEL